MFEIFFCSIYDLFLCKCYVVNLNIRYFVMEVLMIVNFCIYMYGFVCCQMNFFNVRLNNWLIIYLQCGYFCVFIERCINEILCFVLYVVVMGYEWCGEVIILFDKLGKELLWFCYLQMYVLIWIMIKVKDWISII